MARADPNGGQGFYANLYIALFHESEVSFWKVPRGLYVSTASMLRPSSERYAVGSVRERTVRSTYNDSNSAVDGNIRLILDVFRSFGRHLHLIPDVLLVHNGLLS